jgi:hypothetical protein
MRSTSGIILLVVAIGATSACTPKSPEHRALLKTGVKVRAPKGVHTVVYQRTITREGKDSAAGKRTVISRVITSPQGQKQLEVVQRFPGGGGIIVDTAVAELKTLFAVSHASHQPTKTMQFDLRDYFADGRVIDTSRKVVNVHQSLGGPIYDSNIIDLVVASLPLEKGYSVELPFFIYERGGRVPMRVKVESLTRVEFPVASREVWVVSVAVPGAPATVWVDPLTRDVMRVRYDIAARQMSFTDDRITPVF